MPQDKMGVDKDKSGPASKSGSAPGPGGSPGTVDPRSPSSAPIGSPGRISQGMNPKDANVDIGGFGGFLQAAFNALSPIDLAIQENPLSKEKAFGVDVDPVQIGIQVATAIHPALGLIAKGMSLTSDKGTVEAPKEDVTSGGDKGKQKQQKQSPPAEKPLQNVVSPVLSSGPSAEFTQDSIFDQVLDNALNGRPLFTPLS